MPSSADEPAAPHGAPPPRYGHTGVGPGQRPPQRPSHQRPPPPAFSEPRPLAAGRPSSNRRDLEGDEDSADASDSRYENEPEQPKRRQHKYSSANMERGNCRKYICVAMLFLLFLGFSIGLSILIKKVFFSEEEGATGPEAYEMPNSTFTRDKAYVDTACGAATFDQDGGSKCREVCEPQHSECCQAFKPENLYANITSDDNTTSSLSDPTTDRSTDETCSLSTETPGCQSYSKCIAASGNDPSPAALGVYCSEPRLTEDKESCEDICNIHRCCYAQDNRMHCLADKLDVCLDYAPCQNLRKGRTLEVAPSNLDQHCFQQTPECDQICEKAECCNLDHHDNCFQTDFISCLTYAACSYSPFVSTNITVAPQFSVLPKLPKELDTACNERKTPQNQELESTATCSELCEVAACCYDENPADNCFKHDPLGCLAWDQQCQVNKLN